MEKYDFLFVLCVLASFCINASVRAEGIQVQTNSSINELMNEGCIFASEFYSPGAVICIDYRHMMACRLTAPDGSTYKPPYPSGHSGLGYNWSYEELSAPAAACR